MDPPYSLGEQERVAQQHRIGNLLDGSTERSLGLHEIYQDKDGSMREEVSRKCAIEPPLFIMIKAYLVPGIKCRRDLVN